MNDDKNDPARPADPQAGKRPYATLDLKATEIKVTPIAGKTTIIPQTSQTGSGGSATGASGSAVSGSSISSVSATPKPAPASSYGNIGAAMSGSTQTPNIANETLKQTAKPAAASGASSAIPDAAAASQKTQYTSAAASAAAASSNPTPSSAATASKEPPAIVIKRRGGFFSHMAAGIVGGALALSGLLASPMLGLKGIGGDTSSFSELVSQRIAAIEKKFSGNDLAAKLRAAEARLAALEKTADAIPSIKESQTRFIAETKATLAATASDAGAPEQLTRLSALEDKLKALSEAGANDPNAGRVAQLAALTGKVADLETALSTQLTAFRKSVSDDVDARVAAVAASSEAAKSGTQRLDKDIAVLKTDTARFGERVQAMKTDSDKLAESLKMAQEDSAALKTALEAVKGSTAKPADVASAVAPLGEKLAGLEQHVQSIVKAEQDRRSNAERIVLSLELQNLKRALDRGQKYDAELAEVQKASAGKIDLSAIAKFKDQGVPTLGDLAHDFRASANAVIDAETEPTDGSVVARLLAGAKSVVRVRKVSTNPDDKSAEAVVGRMEAALKEGRLGDVLEHSKTLSEKARGAAGPFLAKVSARNSVDVALGAIEGQLKSSLSAAPGESQKSVQ